MKHLTVLGLLAFTFTSIKAQIKDTVGLNIPIKDGQITYQDIIDMPNKSKSDLYRNAQQWFVDYFKSSKDVIQNQDKDDGIIIGKGFIDFNSKVGLGITMTSHDKLTIKIECKDNKYRYTIYDMIIYPPAYNEDNAVSLNRIYGKLIGTEKLPTSKGVAKSVLQSNDRAVKKYY